MLQRRLTIRIFAVVMTALLLMSAAPLSGFVGIKFPKLMLPKLSFPSFSILSRAVSESDLVFSLNSDGVSYSITDCDSGAVGALTIPSEYNALPVTSIGDSAFRNVGITSLTIPESIKTIESSAFYNCVSLESISFSEGLESIGNNAFKQCTSLTEVCLPDTVKTLGIYAFGNCDNIVSINVPRDCIKIGHSAYSCEKLETIYYNADKCGDQYGAYFGAGNAGDGMSFIIGDEVREIFGNISLRDCKATSITIGAGLKRIEKYSFCDTEYLTEINYNAINGAGIMPFKHSGMSSTGIRVNIGDNVESIPLEMFGDVTELGTLESKITEVYIGSNVKKIGTKAFYGCDYLTTIVIGESVETIDNYAFANLPALRSIQYNAVSADDLAANANIFYGTGTSGAGDISVTFGDSVERIPANLFRVTDSSFLPLIGDVTFSDGLKSIGEYAFDGAIGLTSVTIPSSVKDIFSYAFNNCTHLENVIFSSPATTLSENAFAGSEWYNSVTAGELYGGTVLAEYKGAVPANYTIEAGTTGILPGALSGAEAPVTVTIPAGVTGVTGRSFEGCEALTEIIVASDSMNYSAIDGALYNYTQTELLSLPTADSFSYTIRPGVTKIGSGAFVNCPNLLEITVPSAVTEIGDSSFMGLTKLMVVQNNANISAIGYRAFFGCSSLISELTFSNLTTLGDEAFAGCTKLPGINIGGNLESIGYKSFFGCSSLETVALPNTLKSIGASAFSGCIALQSLTLPDMLLNIREYAFFESGLTSITIPNSVHSLGKYLFGNCTELVTAVIGNGLNEIPYGAFDGCSLLLNLNLGNSITSISAYAFNRCTALESVVIPDSVKYIWMYAFCDCTSLTVLTLGRGLSYIQRHALNNCAIVEMHLYDKVNRLLDCDESFGLKLPITLETLTVDSANPYYCAQDNVLYNKDKTELIWCPNGWTGSFVIPDTVKEVQYDVFYNRKLITELTIPESLEISYNMSFRGMTSVSTLYYNAVAHTKDIYPSDMGADVGGVNVIFGDLVTDITKLHLENIPSVLSVTLGNSMTRVPNVPATALVHVPEDHPTMSSVNGAVYNKAGTEFLYCPRAWEGEFTVEEGVEIIQTDAFYMCNLLTSVSLPETIKTISDNAFKDCTLLTEVNTLGTIERICVNAFYNCTALRSIDIRDGLTWIGGYAFYNCISLTSIYIPDGVQNIESRTFSYCSSLTEVVVPGSVRSVGPDAFSNCTGLLRISISNGVRSTGYRMLRNCKSLESVTLSNTMETLASGAFEGCASLKSIILPDSLITIYDGAFRDSGLESIVVPINATNLYEGIFANCTSLKTAEIRSPIRILPISTFSGCTALESVTLPESLTTAGRFAFSGCSSIQSFDVPDNLHLFVEGALNDCSGITEFTVNESNTMLTVRNGILYSKDMKTLVQYPKGLTATSFTVPDTVERIALSAFANNTHLQSVVLPDSVKIIDDFAFTGCLALLSCNLNGVRQIGNYAFYHCPLLRNVVLGCGVEKIGKRAFIYNCNDEFSWSFLKDLRFSYDESIKIYAEEGTVAYRLLNNDFYLRWSLENTDVAHGFDSTVIEPDCINEGYTHNVCRYCKVETDTDFVSALGHTPSEWTVIVQPTNEAPGTRIKCCTVCSEELERESIDSPEYSYYATFVAGGEIVAVVGFNNDTDLPVEPTVPQRDGYTGAWEPYTLGNSDITVNAKYSIIDGDDLSHIDTDTDSDYDDITGVAQVTVSAYSAAKTVITENGVSQPLDIVVVADQSGSMADTLGNIRYTKLAAQKKAITAFVNEVYNNSVDTGTDHRISIVGFGCNPAYGRDYPKYCNTEILTTGGAEIGYGYATKEAYASSLVSISGSRGVNSVITSAIEKLDAYGATAAELGLNMAVNVFANNPISESSQRKRVVVFITDGSPTHLDSFDVSVANSAIKYANELKNVCGAEIYCVGVFDEADSNKIYSMNNVSNPNKFLHYVSSNYTTAQSMRDGGLRNERTGYYMAVNNTDGLSDVFTQIAVKTVTTTALFNNITLVSTVSPYFTMTSLQERALIDSVAATYGLAEDNISVTRNPDGTTKISVSGIHPTEILDGNGEVLEYKASITYEVTYNGNDGTDGSYPLTTADSGVTVENEHGDEFDAVFDALNVQVSNNRSVARFMINSVPYALVSANEGAVINAPLYSVPAQMSFGGWGIPQTGYTMTSEDVDFDATLTPAKYTVTWVVDGNTSEVEYGIGEEIIQPATPRKDGAIFAGWSPAVAQLMPAENLTYIAQFSEHSHIYNKTSTTATCTNSGTASYECVCGLTRTEAEEATGHHFAAVASGRHGKGGRGDFRCVVCGEQYDYSLNYGIGKKNSNGTRECDFTLYDENSSGYQPENDVTIEIPLENNRYNDSYSYTVKRDNGDGTYTEVNSHVDNGMLVFDTGHFSRFIVEETPLYADAEDHGKKICDLYTTEKTADSLDDIPLICATDGAMVTPSVAGDNKEFLGTGTRVEYIDETNSEMPMDVVKYIVLSGDLNGDSMVDALDAMLAQLAANDQVNLGELESLAADCDYNGVVNNSDFISIANSAVGAYTERVYD